MKLNYKEFGEGRPMIILHGLLGSLDNWQTLAKRFAEDFHVFTIDQRNHGQSPHSDRMDYEVLSADLENFIEEHQLDNVILIGHSMGGKTVMKYTLEHPEKVAAMISADMSPRDYPVHHEYILDALRSVDFSAVKTRGDVKDQLMEKLQNKAVVLFLTKNVYWKDKENLAYRFNLDAIYDNIDLVSSWPFTPGVFEGKSLFIRGVKADYISDDEPNIHAYFPNAKIVDIDSGHWVHAEKPDAFYQAVMDAVNS